MVDLKSDRSNKWDQFFVELQSKGRYTFTFKELRNRFKSSEKTLLQGLYRYKTKRQIAQIRKGFYVIIPPSYSNQGMLPPYLFIDDLMKSLELFTELQDPLDIRPKGKQGTILFKK